MEDKLKRSKSNIIEVHYNGEEDEFVATIRGQPGCVATGKTPEQAIDRAREQQL